MSTGGVVTVNNDVKVHLVLTVITVGGFSLKDELLGECSVVAS